MIVIFDIINKLLWGITTILLVSSGIYFSKKLQFPQFNIKKMVKSLFDDKNKDISPFKTLMLSLAARVGVGSLAGVALAIYIGGPGTIFWMWISTIIVVPNAYAESYLSVLFHKKRNGAYEGGPFYYIEKGLNKKNLAKMYSILVIIVYILGFTTIQTNTIAISFHNFSNIPQLVVGLFVALLTAVVIFGGGKSIIETSSKIMPFIGGLFLVFSSYIILSNITKIPSILILIIKSAFNIKAMGIGILIPFIIGVQRGIFSNEAGVGTGGIAAATVDSNDAKGQGYIQMLGVYFTSLVLCTLTALIILLCDYSVNNLQNINGIEITQYALRYHLGTIGALLLLITVFIFAFSTIISGYYYGEISISYLNPNRGGKHSILKIITIVLLIIGSIAKPNLLWNVVDVGIAILAIINTYALFKLRNKIK